MIGEFLDDSAARDVAAQVAAADVALRVGLGQRIWRRWRGFGRRGGRGA